jgi:antitoxin VapB
MAADPRPVASVRREPLSAGWAAIGVESTVSEIPLRDLKRGRLNFSGWMYILHVSIRPERSMKTAKIFKHGNSQAVRLPKEFRFADDEVLIQRSGGGVLLLPREITYERVMAAVGQFKGKVERQQPKDQKRKWR